MLSPRLHHRYVRAMRAPRSPVIFHSDGHLNLRGSNLLQLAQDVVSWEAKQRMCAMQSQEDKGLCAIFYVCTELERQSIEAGPC